MFAKDMQFEVFIAAGRGPGRKVSGSICKLILHNGIFWTIVNKELKFWSELRP
jgi:hypothetical protein